MFFTIISFLPASVGLIAIGLVTFLKNHRSRVSILFFILTITLAVWLVTLFIADIAHNSTVSLWALRFAVGVGSLVVPVLFYFSIYFPIKLKQPSIILQFLIVVPAVLFFILSLTNMIVPSISYRTSSVQPESIGTLYSLQSIYTIVGFLIGFGIILKKLKHVSTREKLQIKFVIAGLVFALVINIFSGFLLAFVGVANGATNLAGGLSLIVFVSLTSYAIIKHRLFDIRMAVARSLGFIVTIGFVVIVYSLFIYIISVLLIDDQTRDLSSGSTLFLLLIPTVFIALTFNFVHMVVAKLSSNIFYKEDYDLKEAIDALSDALITSNTLDKIMARSMQAIRLSINSSHSDFIILDDRQEIYKQHINGKSEHITSKFLTDILEATKKITTNPFDPEEFPTTTLAKFMDEVDSSLLLRLGSKNKVTGLILLGPKQNGSMYSNKDLELLRIGSKNLSIALENAKNFDQIIHFADTLDKEVKRATARLIKANKKLKTLDVLKDDFISMASHQLRTPAASVHQALQTLNHPYLTKDDREEVLKLAEASSEHLVSVVADMLNIARIQAGHFEISKSEEIFQDLVSKVILNTQVLADQKNIDISYKKPSDPIKVNIDVSKMTQATTNYIENAIKYSPPKSKVVIEVVTKDNRVHLKVYDQGMGVPEDERLNLFSKFYRAKNARLEQPDGNGIGLFVVKSVAEIHKGEAYYTPLAKGSLFGLWFPK